MPTLLLQDGFQFFFYANEHEPKHVHVVKGDEYAKIERGTLFSKGKLHEAQGAQESTSHRSASQP
jgi:hypothetical protein